MRTFARVLTIAVAIGACGGQPTAPSSPTAGPSVSVTPSPSPEPSPSLEPSPSPLPELGEMPTAFDADLTPPAIPPEALIPTGATVTGEWFAFTDAGVMVVMAWVEPGSDYSRLPRGYAVWRHADAAPHWRAALVERRDPEDAVQDIQITTGDMTGDSSDDLLVFEGAGGTGACGAWALIDLTRFRSTYRRAICDGRIDPGPLGAPGLLLTESVFREGDAHCCPSAIRTTTLTWTGSEWQVTDTTVVET
jgi:hypothetical protein